MGGKPVGRNRTAMLALACVVGALAANLIFNLAAARAGLHHPYSSFLFLPQDRFADFFKLSFSYPGAPMHPVSSSWGLDPLLNSFRDFVEHNDLKFLNHFHVPPLPTMLALSWRATMTVVDPVLLYYLWAVGGLVTLGLIAYSVTDQKVAAIALAALAVVNYPIAFMLDRGHIFSLVCGIVLSAALLRKEKPAPADWLSILLFAIAFNFRPNAAIFPVGLWLCNRGWSTLDLVKFGTAAVAVFAAAFLIDHAVYPAYTPQSWMQGMNDYAVAYLGYNFGLAYGSSLYGALKATFGYSAVTYWLPPIITAVTVILLAVSCRRTRMPQSHVAFVLASLYCIGAQVFADYHLMVFVVPLALLVREGGIRRAADWAVFTGSCFVLSPKNYLFHQYEPNATPWSWQILMNPVVLLVASAVVVGLALTRSERRSDEPRAEAPAGDLETSLVAN